MKTAKLRSAAPPVTKICSKCKQTKTLQSFYSNKDWTEQLGKDVWCKDCVGKCATKDELRGYESDLDDVQWEIDHYYDDEE